MFAPPKKKAAGVPAGLKRPSSVASGNLRPVTAASSSGALKLSSQSSLLNASRPKSTSRSSILSDTTASVCSSSATSSKPQPANGQDGKSSLSRKSSTSSLSGGRTAGSSVVVVRSSPLATRTGPTATSASRRPSLLGSSGSSTSSTSSSSTGGLAASSRRSVPTLAMSLRDKDQQIKLLIKERDEQKFQAELMAKRAEEWEEKFVQSEVEKSHVTSEADDEVVELRRLAQELEDENRTLVERLNEREQLASDVQFKLDELECEKSELKRELLEKEDLLNSMAQEKSAMEQGKPVALVQSERSISKAKYEHEIEELKEKLMGKEEQMIQLRTSLEMRKNEVSILQTHAGDLERKLKIECERSERHLKRIDEVNLELKATETKLATKTESNEIYEAQVKQLRQELRTAEEKLEQLSLARKKDIDILHNKLASARRGSTTPTSPQPYKTPTPQDEIVRLQMEIRDLKDQLIDREAELDCNRRDLEVMKRKMETRTLEVDCNNQELARRCQDLLEQNRQSEDTVKQLLKSTTEHSAQLMHATEDLKEANGKCIKMRDEISQLEANLESQLQKSNGLAEENARLEKHNEQLREQVETLRQQVDSLNGQISDLCQQLDVQTCNLHNDREALADQLSQQEIDLAQLRHDLAGAKQDLRSSRIQTQEVQGERERLKADMDMKEQYIASRNDIIETMRHELEDCKRSLLEYKQKLEDLRQVVKCQEADKDTVCDSLKAQIETLKGDCKAKDAEGIALRDQCELLRKSLDEAKATNEEEELKRFDEMRQKHSQEIDVLKSRLTDLELQLEEARSATLKAQKSRGTNDETNVETEQQATVETDNRKSKVESACGVHKDEYESQIEFLNSLVVDMQRKCDDYKSRLAQMETQSIMNEFDNIMLSNSSADSRSSTLLRRPPVPQRPSAEINSKSQLNGNTGTLKRVSINTDINTVSHYNDRPSRRISGRPFCDICQVFDLHHTVYCPKVSEKLAARSELLDESHARDNSNNNNSIIINNNNNNHNSATTRGLNNDNGARAIEFSSSDVDEMFREYERSIEREPASKQFASLRRLPDKPVRAYCDHCDLFGHTIKSCNSLSQRT